MFYRFAVIALFIATFALHAGAPSGTICIGQCPPAETKKPQRFYFVNNPHHDPFSQQLRNDIALQQLAQEVRLREEKLLAEEYHWRGIDPIWASQAARNVSTRCTVINFGNGGMLAKQVIPPSQLPQEFADDFSSISWFGHLFERHRPAEDFMREFNRKLSDLQLEYSYESHVRHARAAMRQWRLYRYPNFCHFLQRFCMYDEYMLEIAAQMTHDQDFVRHVTYACEGASAYILQEAQRIENKRAQVAAEAWRVQEEQIRIARQQTLLVEQKNVRDAYSAQEQGMLAEEQSWHDLHSLYQAYGCGEQTHLASRMQAVRTMHDSGVVYGDKIYQLHGDVSRLLTDSGCAVEAYKHCYGNQLQQVIHKECIQLLEYATTWSSTQLYICPQDSFVDSVLTGDYEKYTEDAIEQGIKWVMKDDNKISHIFGRDNKHNFDSLVQVLGGREELLRAVLQQLNGRVPFAEVFKDVIVHVNKREILVRGIILDGIPNLGTIFIK